MYNRQNMEKRQRFSIRKLTVGTCSVIIGAFFFGTLQPVSATEAAATEVVATAVENTPASEAATAEEKPAVESGATATEVTPKEEKQAVSNEAANTEATDKVEEKATEAATEKAEAKPAEAKPAEEKPAAEATGETREATGETREATAEVKKEWDSVSRVKGNVEVFEEGGVRYNKLTSTTANDNGANEALFEKAGLQADAEGNVSVDLTFKANTPPAETRFGVYVKYRKCKDST